MKSMRNLMPRISILLIGGLLFSACEPGPFSSVECHTIMKKEDANLYLIYYHKISETEIKRTVKLKDVSECMEKATRLNCGNIFPTIGSLQKEMPEIAAGDIFYVDSIGVYDKRNDELKAMFYGPQFKDKVSSTTYTNPYLKTSWIFQLDEKGYKRYNWDVSLGEVIYTLKIIPTKE